MPNYNLSELKEALNIKINLLRQKYMYTGISASDFDKYVNSSLDDINKIFNKNYNCSLDKFFEDRVDIYMSSYIRNKLIISQNIIISYVESCSLDINSIESCNNIILGILEIYKNCYYIPSYLMVYEIFKTSKRLSDIFSMYTSSIIDYKDTYKNASDTLKVYFEVYNDFNNIDSFSLISNDAVGINKLNELLIRKHNGDSKSLFDLISTKRAFVDEICDLYNIADRKIIEDIFNGYINSCDLGNIHGGLFLNDIRLQIHNRTDKSYELSSFINNYDKHLEFATINDFIFPTKILRKGLYINLQDFDDSDIEKIIEMLPSKYLVVLYNCYGKSLRYYNFNTNISVPSYKKLSVVLATMRDFLKYKNHDYSFPFQVKSNLKTSFESVNILPNVSYENALSDLRSVGYLDNLKNYNDQDKIVIMLKLGCISNKEYSNEEISKFLNIDNNYINKIVVDFLNNYKEKVTDDIDKLIYCYKK